MSMIVSVTAGGLYLRWELAFSMVVVSSEKFHTPLPIKLYAEHAIDGDWKLNQFFHFYLRVPGPFRYFEVPGERKYIWRVSEELQS